MNKAEAEKLFKRYGGREGISIRILAIATEMVQVNSYKRATAGAGQLRFLAEIADKADDYWSEMVHRGQEKEEGYGRAGRDTTPPILASDGHYSNAYWEKIESKRAEGKDGK